MVKRSRFSCRAKSRNAFGAKSPKPVRGSAKLFQRVSRILRHRVLRQQEHERFTAGMVPYGFLPFKQTSHCSLSNERSQTCSQHANLPQRNTIRSRYSDNELPRNSFGPERAQQPQFHQDFGAGRIGQRVITAVDLLNILYFVVKTLAL